MADAPTPDPPAPDDTPTVEPPAAPDPKPDTDDLGDGGKAALKAERAQRAKAEREAKDLRARLEAIEAENQTEAEKAITAARQEGLSEGLSVAHERIVRAEVRAVAGTRLNDPADAVALLDLSDFKVDDDGNVDTKAIASAIDALVKDKPYLAATARQGTGGAGARQHTDPPSIEAQIADLEAKGDLKAAMSLKNRRLVAGLQNQT